MKLGILTSHPIQYHAPLFRELATRIDLAVFFAHRISAQQQGEAGYGVPFVWDVDLLDGYNYRFLTNCSRHPGVDRFSGCDTPDVRARLATDRVDALLVTGWHLKSYWQGVSACRRLGLPVMVRGDSHLQTPRTRLKQTVKGLIYPWLLGRFDAALYVGYHNHHYLLHYGFPPERLFFAPHSVDVRFFSEAAARSDRSSVRASWGVSGNARAVLFTGRLVGFKRPADLVEALGRLGCEGLDVVGIFAGDGELREDLRALGERLGVRLVFLGFRNQTELPAIYAAADILVLPSTGSETWGLVVNEALACGTPCVVSDACGCAPDMVEAGVTGEVFPCGDVPAFANAIASALRISHGCSVLRERSDRYSVSNAASGVIEATRWMLNQRRRSG